MYYQVRNNAFHFTGQQHHTLTVHSISSHTPSQLLNPVRTGFQVEKKILKLKFKSN